MIGRVGRRIFLCHASPDKARVRRLHHRLKADGFVPWLDERDLLPGDDWELSIKKAVRASDYVVVCLSRASTTRAGYVHKEIKQALDVADRQPEGTLFIVPVRLEDCQVPERLVHLHWVDLFRRSGYPQLVRTLRHNKSLLTIEVAVSDDHIGLVTRLTSEFSFRGLDVRAAEIVGQPGDLRALLTVDAADEGSPQFGEAVSALRRHGSKVNLRRGA